MGAQGQEAPITTHRRQALWRRGTTPHRFYVHHKPKPKTKPISSRSPSPSLSLSLSLSLSRSRTCTRSHSCSRAVLVGRCSRTSDCRRPRRVRAEVGRSSLSSSVSSVDGTPCVRLGRVGRVGGRGWGGGYTLITRQSRALCPTRCTRTRVVVVVVRASTLGVELGGKPIGASIDRRRPLAGSGSERKVHTHTHTRRRGT